MKPPKKEYEQVRVDEWIVGEIVEIQYEKEHDFTFKGVVTKRPGVKIYLALDGYKEKKSTGWWSFNYGDKSKLYKFFIHPLVEGARPNLDFDLDALKNLRIKVMYAQNGEYQNLMAVRPDAGKVLSNYKPIVQDNEETVPF